MKKKPRGQIFPEEFYEMFLTPIKFWTTKGENKMLNRLAWLLILGLVGFNTYFMVEINSKKTEILNKLQSTTSEIQNAIGQEMNSRIRDITNDVTDGLTNEIVTKNKSFMEDVQTTLTENTKEQKRVLSLLHEKIDFYGTKIDYFENNLDSVLLTNNEQMLEIQKSNLKQLKSQVSDIKSDLQNIDTLFNKLQNNFWTKGAFK